MDDNDDDDNETPLADPLTQLPEVSRHKYETAYKRFMEWKATTNEDVITSNVIMDYFERLTKSVKPTTLWSQYSMLRNTINFHHNIDISRFPKLRPFLKRQCSVYTAKSSKILTPNEINTFLRDAPDGKYLLTKVVLIIGMTGRCRREELWKLRVDDLEDLNTALTVRIPDKNKKVIRTFTIAGSYYNIYKKYALLRPMDTHEARFFFNYFNGKCTKQPLGINKIGTMAKQIAIYLKLPNPNLYTGHCFRKSSSGTNKVMAVHDMHPLYPPPLISFISNGMPTRPYSTDIDHDDNDDDDSNDSDSREDNNAVKNEVDSDDDSMVNKIDIEQVTVETCPSLNRVANSTSALPPNTITFTENYLKEKRFPGITINNCSNISINYHFK